MSRVQEQPTISVGAMWALIAALITVLGLIIWAADDEPSYICSRAPEMVDVTVCEPQP